MATNEGWPEAFGFSMSYGAPCIIDWVEDGGSAEESGLQVTKNTAIVHTLNFKLVFYI